MRRAILFLGALVLFTNARCGGVERNDQVPCLCVRQRVDGSVPTCFAKLDGGVSGVPADAGLCAP